VTNSIKWYDDKELERILPNEGTIMALYDENEENQKNLRIVSVPAEICTEKLMNTSPKHCCHINLFRMLSA
jgi:hypothetical protein